MRKWAGKHIGQLNKTRALANFGVNGMGGYGYGYGHGMMDNFSWLGFHGFGWILMILWWGLILAGLVFLLRWLFLKGSKGSAKVQNEDQALEILRQRYARSEIGKEEYEEKLKELQR